MRTEGKISVRNCPQMRRLQNYTGFGTSKAAMVQKCKAVLEGRGFRPKFSMKILLVEDDEGTAEILKNTLITQHYVVDLAMDGRTGLSLVEAFTYDLVLLDIMLGYC